VEVKVQSVSKSYALRYIKKKMKVDAGSSYVEYEEIIDNLTSGCPTLAKSEYIIRQ
jgi:hypothetical protein